MVQTECKVKLVWTLLRYSPFSRSKNNQFSDTFAHFFGKKINLAHIKLISLFIMALCKARTVALIQRYIRLFGKDSIDCMLADREFVGEKRIGWLNSNRIRYFVRVRENFWVDSPSSGNLSAMVYRQLKPIRVLTHGRKEKSIFRYGLDIVAEFLMRGRNEFKIPIFDLFSIANQIVVTT